MIIKLLENIAWTLCFTVILFIYTGGMGLLGVVLEERMGTVWTTIVIILLNVIIVSILHVLISGGFYG